jgi:hypothetical protein
MQVQWVTEKHVECLLDCGKVNANLVTDIIMKEFLGHICKKKDKYGHYLEPVQYHAFQHVSGLF